MQTLSPVIPPARSFRETFHKMYPASPYEYVMFCHTCRRFDFEVAH
ncbi:hypothetical protein HH176_005029 [Escherichia coli]|nr:hypothetical protein [Escherichia coli]EFH6383839.1 hypothetical protein [Escherichia coli]